MVKSTLHGGYYPHANKAMRKMGVQWVKEIGPPRGVLLQHPSEQQVARKSIENDIDSRDHKQQAEQIGIGRQPPPEPATQDRRPMIERASGRVCRGDLA